MNQNGKRWICAPGASALLALAGCHEGDPFVFGTAAGGGSATSSEATTTTSGTGGSGGEAGASATASTTGTGGAAGTGGSGGSGGSGGATSGTGGAAGTGGSGGSGGSGGATSGTGGAGGQGGGGVVGQDTLWSRGSGSGDGYDMRAYVASDPSGNVILTGSFAGTMDLGAGSMTALGSQTADTYLIKYTPDGTVLWSKQWGDALDQWGGPMAVDAQSIVVGVRTLGTIDFGGQLLTSQGAADMCLAKLTPGGDRVWSNCFGGAGEQFAWALALGTDGSTYVSATNAGSLDMGGGVLTSAGGADIVLAKLDGGGNVLWRHQYGDATEQVLRSVATLPSGDIIAAGSIQGAVNFGGETLTAASLDDAVVVELDASGNHVWSARWGDLQSQRAVSVATNAAGEAFVTGDFRGGVSFGGGNTLSSSGASDAFVVKLDAAREVAWMRGYGGALEDGANSVTVDPSGDLLVTGYFTGTVDFGGQVLTSVAESDVFVLKLASDGTFISARSFGAAGVQQTAAIASDPWGHPLISGVFAGNIDFGNANFSTAKIGLFVAKLAP